MSGRGVWNLARARLLDAADLVDGRGWCSEGRACDLDGNPVDPLDGSAAAWSLEGALDKAFENDRGLDAVEASELAAAEVANALPEREYDPELWNEDPATTRRDVVRVLRAAAGGIPLEG